jgi:hypothetical protein
MSQYQQASWVVDHPKEYLDGSMTKLSSSLARAKMLDGKNLSWLKGKMVEVIALGKDGGVILELVETDHLFGV